jgi:hypothetical protein
MVHPVHDPISVWAQVIRPLEDPGQDKKYLFRRLVHGKGPVRGIPVKEKRLKEKRQVPVGSENEQNGGHEIYRFTLISSTVLAQTPLRQGICCFVTDLVNFF